VKERNSAQATESASGAEWQPGNDLFMHCEISWRLALTRESAATDEQKFIKSAVADCIESAVPRNSAIEIGQKDF
jgi:hypothetical protein